MITGIAIENFKGIGQRIEIPFKPITLLFGPNSTGKSSIIHALHYAREIFDRRNLNPDSTVSGGKFVDLGGFRGLVHQHDLKKPVKIAVDLDLKTRELPTYDESPPYDYADEEAVDRSDQPNDLLELGEMTSARVETEITWSEIHNRPDVTGYSVALDGQPIGSIKGDEDGKMWLTLNFRHRSLIPIRQDGDLFGRLLVYVPHFLVRRFDWAAKSSESDDELRPITRITKDLFGDDLIPGFMECVQEWDRSHLTENGSEYVQRIMQFGRDWLAQRAKVASERSELEAALIIAQAWGTIPELCIQNDHACIPVKGSCDPLPRWESQLQFEWNWDILKELGESGSIEEFPIADQNYLQYCLYETLSRAIVGPGQLVRDCLAEFRYLGPLREMPSRDYVPPNFPDDSRWASGLGAWDRLEAVDTDDTFIEAASHWLGDENRLSSGYRLRLKRFKELDLSDPLVVQLLTGHAFDEADAKLDLNRVPTQSRLLIVPTDESIELRPSDVGIGISQVVPVIVTALDGTGRTIAVEQPELHLHPKLQAALGDLFIEGALGDRRHRFLLETHSEHLILRLLKRIRETTAGKNAATPAITPDDVMLLYVHTVDGQSRFMELRTDKHGRLIDTCPEGFFEEDFAELF